MYNTYVYVYVYVSVTVCCLTLTPQPELCFGAGDETFVFDIITTRGSLAQRGPFLLLLFFSLGAVWDRRENNSFKSSKGK